MDQLRCLILFPMLAFQETPKIIYYTYRHDEDLVYLCNVVSSIKLRIKLPDTIPQSYDSINFEVKYFWRDFPGVKIFTDSYIYIFTRDFSSFDITLQQ